MKFTLKKTETGSLHPLNEKEIQKRLYGRYHRDDTTSAADPNCNSTLPKAEIRNTSRPSFSLTVWFANFTGRLQGLFLKFGRKFPWKFSVIVTGSLIVSVVLLQALSAWFGKVRINSQTPSEPVVNKLVSASPIKKSIEVAAPPSLSAAPAARPAATTVDKGVQRKRYYAVQVCTYERETDAQQLTNELKGLNFPAFHLRFPSSQQGLTHYVVFLGKEETYATANAKLNEFRKTKDFQRFPDSFIRSI